MRVSCLLLLICTFILGWEHCSAQEEDIFGTPPAIFEGRLILGTNITQVDGDSYSGYHKLGLNTGGMVYIHLSHSIGASIELTYAQKGSRGAHVMESYYVGTYFDKYYLNLNYIELPVLLHWKQTALLDFEAGVSYAQLTGSKEWGLADVPVQIFPELNYFNSTDICYVGGATFRLNKHLYANLRMQYSIMPIRPWDRIPPHYFVSYAGEYNNVVTLRLMYRL